MVVAGVLAGVLPVLFGFFFFFFLISNIIYFTGKKFYTYSTWLRTGAFGLKEGFAGSAWNFLIWLE